MPELSAVSPRVLAAPFRRRLRRRFSRRRPGPEVPWPVVHRAGAGRRSRPIRRVLEPASRRDCTRAAGGGPQTATRLRSGGAAGERAGARNRHPLRDESAATPWCHRPADRAARRIRATEERRANVWTGHTASIGQSVAGRRRGNHRLDAGCLRAGAPGRRGRCRLRDHLRERRLGPDGLRVEGLITGDIQ